MRKSPRTAAGEAARRFGPEVREQRPAGRSEEPLPSRFEMRRKDSITLAKLRMHRQQGEGAATSHNEQGADKDASSVQSGSDEKKHPIFRPPTFINIVSEQAAEEASCSDVAALAELKAAGKARLAHLGKPSATGKAQAATDSRAQIDPQVTSSGKKQAGTFTKEITMSKNTAEMVKKALAEMSTDAAGQPSAHIVPQEDLAEALAAMVIDGVDAACMDNRSEQPF